MNSAREWYYMYPRSDLMTTGGHSPDDWQPYSQNTLLSPLLYKMISSWDILCQRSQAITYASKITTALAMYSHRGSEDM